MSKVFGAFAGAVVFQLALAGFLAGCWIGNIVQLVRCDWNPNGSWKGEIIHAAGLVVTPASVVTVWFDDK